MSESAGTGHEARYALVWSLASAILSAGLGLLLVPVYLHHLGTEAYGLIGFVLALQVWLQLLDLGLALTAGREAARYLAGAVSVAHWRDLWHSMERVYLIMSCAMLLGIWASAPWIASQWLQLTALEVGTVVQAIRWLGAALALQWSCSLYKGALNGGHQQIWLARVNSFVALFRGALTWGGLVWIAPTLEVFAGCQFAAAAIEWAWHRLRLRQIVPPGRPRFSADALRTVWRFAGGLSLISVLATVQQQLDKLVLSKLLPLEQFAWIALAVTVSTAISVVIAPVFNLAAPRLTQLVAGGRADLIAHEYHRHSQLAAWLTLPVAGTLIGFSGEVIGAWTGSPALARHVGPLVSIWMVGSAINALLHVPYALQLAHGWIRPALTLNAIAICVHLALLFWLIPLQGAMAGAIAWVAVNAIYLTAGMIWTHRKLLPAQLGPWYLRNAILPTLLVTAIVGTIRMGANHFVPLTRVGMATWAAASLAACFVTMPLLLPDIRAASRSWLLAMRRTARR